MSRDQNDFFGQVARHFGEGTEIGIALEVVYTMVIFWLVFIIMIPSISL